MQIAELIIRNFGKFTNKTIRLSDGIQLIYGENESGKSTIHAVRDRKKARKSCV